MNKGNRISWDVWRQAVEYCYVFSWRLENRLAEGETLTEAELEWLNLAKSVTARYQENGDRKETVTIGIA